MTADTITIRCLIDLEQALIIAANDVRRIRRHAINGDITTDQAAAELKRIAGTLADLTLANSAS